MRTVQLLLLFFLITSCLNANVSIADSLYNLIKVAEHDTQKVKIYLEIGDVYEYEVPDTAILLYKKAIEVATTGQKKFDANSIDYAWLEYWKAKAISFIGIVYKRLSKYKEAEIQYNRSLKCLDNVINFNDSVLHREVSYGKANLLESFGMLHDDLGNYEIALDHYYKALEIKTAMNDLKGVSITYNNIGIVYENMGEYYMAIEIYRKALDFFSENQFKTGMAHINNNLSLVYKNLGNHTKAMQILNDNLKIYDDLIANGDEQEIGRNKYALAYTYGNIGIIHYNLKNYENAIEYYNNAAHIFEDFGDQRGLALCYNNIGNAYLDMGKLDKSEEYFQLSYSIKEETDDRRGLSSTLNNFGLLYEKRNMLNKALDCYLRSLELKKEINSKSGEAHTLHNIASLYSKMGNYSKAAGYAKKSYDLSVELDQVEDIMYACSALSKAYEGQGNTKDALKFYKEYTVLKDSLFALDKNKQILEIETRYETEKKEKEITLLKKDQEIKNLTISEKDLKLRSKTLQVFILVVAIILVVTVFILIYYSYRQKQRKILHEKMVEEKQARMKAIIDTQEKERSRIARDLHDGIGQLLSAASMNFNKIAGLLTNSGNNEIKLDQPIKVLNDACDELRSISHQMMPKSLKESGVVVALNDLLNKSFGQTDIQCNFETFNIKDRFLDNIEVGLYRICQELTGNIIKHSGATEVNIQLYKNNENIVLVVEDDGRGIPEKIISDGAGLQNIYSRTEALNGIFQIERGPDSGTVALVRVPIKKPPVRVVSGG